MNSSKKVVRTTATIEYAMKWSDACIAEVLGNSFIWSYREVESEQYSRSCVEHRTEIKNFIATKREIKITGKIGGKQVVAQISILGLEDLDDPRASIRQDDVSGPEQILISEINISIQEKGRDKTTCLFGVDTIPGLDQRQMIELAAA